jgi:choline dehydrogenase-like flavoprotein
MIARHAQATEQEHPFMLGIELGADFNQGRYVDPDNLAREIAQRGDWTLCELVCQYNAPLVETNSLTVSARSVDAGGAADPVIVDVQRALPSAQALSEVDTLAHDLLDALGAQPVIGATNGLGLNDAVLGGVAHEVGTLRMTDSAAGVVDPDLRFLDYDNLYACDNSTFPSSPAANPTLTLVALALRLADHIDDVLGPA